MLAGGTRTGRSLADPGSITARTRRPWTVRRPFDDARTRPSARERTDGGSHLNQVGVPDAGKTATTYRPGFDVLRLVAIAGVVAIHVASPLLNHLDPAHPGRWWVGNLVFSLTRWTVPIFVMISGALTIGPRSASLVDFWRGRIPRLAIPLTAWTFIYWIFRIVHEGLRPDLGWLARSVLTTTTYGHLYFLAILLGLAAATPVIAAFWRIAGDRERLVLTCMGLGLGLAYRALQEPHIVGPVMLLDWWLPFVGYFLAGAYLSEVRLSQRSRRIAVVLFAASAGMVALGAWLSRSALLPLPVGTLYSYLGPLAMVGSLSAFVIAIPLGARFRPQYLRRLATLVLGIYLINPLLVALVRDIAPVPAGTAPAAVYVVIVTAIVTAGSAGLTLAGSRVRWVRRIVT